MTTDWLESLVRGLVGLAAAGALLGLAGLRFRGRRDGDDTGDTGLD